MQLLEAVNEVLRSVGESPVQTLNSNHPEVVAIQATIQAQNLRRQKRGWWFNVHVETLTSSALPADTRYARPLNRSLDYYPRGGNLYDRKTGQPVTTFPVEVEIQQELAFDDLPDEFADYVVAAACMAYAADYDADQAHLEALGTKVREAEISVHRMHIRYYMIGQVSKRLQGRGWWFNKVRTTITPGSGGALPKNILFAKPTLLMLDYIVLGNRLIDRNTRQPISGPVECEVRYFIEDFNELPDSFRAYVEALAELERAQDFLPESSSIPRLQAVMEQARRNAQQDHIKYAGVNLFGIPSVGVPIARHWGMRYRP